MEYQTGHKYQVPCAGIRLREDGRIYAIPVFAQPHSDAQFNFPQEHYHIDGRFETHPQMRHRLQIEDGMTRSVILPGGTDWYEFVDLSFQQLTCERQRTGLQFAGHAADLSDYEAWYQSYIDKPCQGRHCPHLGTEMLEQNGALVCPMHHLTVDIKTKKIIERRT